MIEVPEHCPNCGEKVKIGAFSSNQLLSNDKLAAINLVHGESRTHACNHCGDEVLESARLRIGQEISSLQRKLEAVIDCVPLISIHSPLEWRYRAIGIVTAQSTTGTGLFSDVTTAFTDVFGVQSNAYNQKLRSGEKLCKNALRLEAIRLGGNAIVAVDVDYAEVGGQRAMLMVCMTGTAISLENLEIVSADLPERIAVASELSRKLTAFQSMKIQD